MKNRSGMLFQKSKQNGFKMHKIMALDIGTKRIGVAVSDFLQVLANPLEAVARIPEKAALARISELAKSNSVQKIVVGLPYNMDGSQGAQAKDCKDFAVRLEGFEIVFADERLTSQQAEENLREKKIDFRKDKSLIDIESACIILEQYMSENCR